MWPNKTILGRLMRGLQTAIERSAAPREDKNHKRSDPPPQSSRTAADKRPERATIWDDAQLNACLQSHLMMLRMQARLTFIQENLRYAIARRRPGAAAGGGRGSAEDVAARHHPR